ncbi:MAG TPA: hypothetical protein VNG12_13675 [Acidimicrobiales bacterium]|nr:hypothetical protein [Acidimicrobiales bacterium]
MIKPGPPILSVLRHLDIDELGPAVRQESRARQHHLPPISVYRWWARRTETVTGAVIDAVNEDLPGRLLIADPFAGGGVIALAALMRGHQIYAQDVNPWAARSLATMLDLPAPDQLEAAGDRLRIAAEEVLDRAYVTTFSDGTPAAVAHTMRVATAVCPDCRGRMRLFPTALVSLLSRVDTGGERGYVACRAGHLNLASATKSSRCKTCHKLVHPADFYTAGRRAICAGCGWTGRLTELAKGGFRWDVVLVERVAGSRREIAPPNRAEIAAAAPTAWLPRRSLPAIAAGKETSVLINHGMAYWHDLFPARQRVIIETLLGACRKAAKGAPAVVAALQAAVIGSTEMAGYTSRWDARYLKAYEAVSNHRFSFTTLAVEPNVFGINGVGRGTVERRLEHMTKAVVWLEEHLGHRPVVQGPMAASGLRTALAQGADARVVWGSSARLCAQAGSVDAVVTDPAYHDDVQYQELSDLFRAWAGEPTGAIEGDAVVRRGDAKSTEAYRMVLTEVFTEMRRALRPNGHLILSYANRKPVAWVAVFRALDDAGFRAVGYEIVHSENETDHSKSGRRACNLDVLLDLVPAGKQGLRRYSPSGEPDGDEEAYCRIVGTQALEVGRLAPGWEMSFKDKLDSSPFLS